MSCMMRFFAPLLIFISLLFAGACRESPEPSANDGFDASKSDAKALQIVDTLWKALGGKENWQKARYLGFRWIVESEGQKVAEYRHDWDRTTNRYRVEGSNREGNHFVAIFNTESKEGEVYLDSEKMPADSTKAKLLQNAYGRYINDSYWLLMPYKLNDPGVILTYDGEREIADKIYDVIKVTFEDVGLTPGDTYWAYIDKDDHLMKKWQYFLQGWEEDKEPAGAWWQDWQDFGGIKLAMNKEFEGRPARIYFEDVKVSQTPDEKVFELTSKTF